MLFFKYEASESQRVIKGERSGSQQGLGLQNRRQRVMSRPWTALSAMVYFKENDVVLEGVYESSVELSSAATEACKVQRPATE